MVCGIRVVEWCAVHSCAPCWKVAGLAGVGGVCVGLGCAYLVHWCKRHTGLRTIAASSMKADEWVTEPFADRLD